MDSVVWLLSWWACYEFSLWPVQTEVGERRVHRSGLSGLGQGCSQCERGDFISVFSLGNVCRPKWMFPADSFFEWKDGPCCWAVKVCLRLGNGWESEEYRVEYFTFQGHSSTEGLAWEKECSSCQEFISQLINLAAREPQTSSLVTGVIDNLFSYFNS